MLEFWNSFNFAMPQNRGVISRKPSNRFVKSLEHGLLTGCNFLFNTFANEVNITIGSLFYLAVLHTFNDMRIVTVTYMN